MAGKNCVKQRKLAWWYKRCFDSNLNDVYYQNPKILPAPGKTTLKYSLKKNELKICPPNLLQHLSQDNKSNHQNKTKKTTKNTKKITVVICTKGARCFVAKFLYSFQIVIANISCKFLLQIDIVNSYCKGLSYILIANDYNCNASLVNVAQ